MYSAYGNEIQAAVTVPIALYQGTLNHHRFCSCWLWLGTQIAIAQFSVLVVKRWILQGEDSDLEDEVEEEKAGTVDDLNTNKTSNGQSSVHVKEL